MLITKTGTKTHLSMAWPQKAWLEGPTGLAYLQGCCQVPPIMAMLGLHCLSASLGPESSLGVCRTRRWK